MSCGLCGSGITAEEKFKKLKDGTVNRHVYYGCAKSKDRFCKCGYINEVELIQQFMGIMDKINLNEIKVKEKIKKEVERIKKFNRLVMGTEEKIEVKEIDIRNYAKYILKEASDIEKRELLGCLNNKIILENKVVSISQS